MKTKTFFLLLILHQTLAQKIDSTQTPSFLKGQITATNNGVSLIPSFSLGKPAVLFDMNIGRGKLSFDPMIRFGMNGKPWAFIFWWRYKLLQNKKYALGIGAHPSFVFRDVAVVNNVGETKKYLNAQRYFAWEVAPTYFINKQFNFGVYYLGSHGLTKDVVQYTTFIAVRSGMNFKLNKNYSLNLIPQAYYLKMDKNDGTYVNATLNIYKSKFPISLNAVASQALQTDIAGKKFLWSIGAVYNVNERFLKLK
jgi:hypothetical protein